MRGIFHIPLDITGDLIRFLAAQFTQFDDLLLGIVKIVLETRDGILLCRFNGIMHMLKNLLISVCESVQWIFVVGICHGLLLTAVSPQFSGSSISNNG